MQTVEALKHLINQVKFRDWTYHFYMDETRPILQIKFMAPCSDTGEMMLQSCRKWFLSFHMTDSEVIQTVFAATLRASEHEVREDFTWRDEPICRPHFDIHSLWELSNEGKIEKRKA